MFAARNMTFCRSSGFTFADSDAAAYVAAVESADAASLEDGVKSAIDALFVGLKADGEWNAFGVFRIYAGPRTLAGCAVPAKGVAPTLVNFVSGDLNRETGLVGDAASKYINQNRDNGTDGQNDRQQWTWATTLHSDGVIRYLFGVGLNTSGGQMYRCRPSDNSSARRCVGASGSNSTFPSAGLIGVSRSGSASYVSRENATSTTYTVASVSPLAGDLYSMATNSGGAIGFGSHRVAFDCIGAAWTSPANIESRINTYLAAIAAAIV